MILDVLDNAHRYLSIHQGFPKAVRFLSRPDLKELPAGRYEIDGETIYAMVSMGPGRNREEALLETHGRYVDIQLVLAGADTMGWKPKSLCLNSSGPYDPDTDVQFFTDEPDTWFCVKPGAFAIFFLEDAHAPLVSTGRIHKVVVKVKAKPEANLRKD